MKRKKVERLIKAVCLGALCQDRYWKNYPTSEMTVEQSGKALKKFNDNAKKMKDSRALAATLARELWKEMKAAD